MKVWGGGVRKASLSREASIYSAEIHAIQMAVDIFEESNAQLHVIFSDSCSVLRTLPIQERPIL